MSKLEQVLKDQVQALQYKLKAQNKLIKEYEEQLGRKILVLDLLQIADYLWELKCMNEWRRDTTTRNIGWLDELQDTIDQVNNLINISEIE